MSTRTYTDCRSEVGITVGLIDSVISICRILANRDLHSIECTEALKDLQGDEDVIFLMTFLNVNAENKSELEK